MILVKGQVKQLPRYGENIYRRKDGRWEGRYIAMRLPDGRAKYKSVYGFQPTCPVWGRTVAFIHISP